MDEIKQNLPNIRNKLKSKDKECKKNLKMRIGALVKEKISRLEFMSAYDQCCNTHIEPYFDFEEYSCF